MKRFLCLAICLMLLPLIPVSAAQNKQPSQLHVEGRYIYNASGEKVRLTGLNIPDLQWATGGDNDLDKRIEMACDQWNANCIRLCVHSKFWFGEEWYQNGDSSGYRKKVDDIIKKVAAKGKYVILNLHEFYTITEKNKQFWEDASQVYKNNPAVIFGLLNEPHDISWDVWKNGGTIKTTDSYGMEYEMKTYGHQQIIDMLRAQGAKNVVIAGGLDWSYYFNGITDGYDGLEHGYRLEEPADSPGNGIIYDTHIYPMKPENNPWEKAIDCVVDDVPILVGEFGHWGERLFDWYDNYLCEYPYIWMNEILDYINRNEINYTAWSFHIGAAPAMFTNYDTFEPTKHSGLAQKFSLLYDTADSRPPEQERGAVDPSPLSTWEHTVDFDEGSPEVLVYGGEVKTEKTKQGYEGGGQLVSFDRKKADAGSAAIFDFPSEWELSGAQWVSLRIKGDGDQRDLAFGIELTDGRQFICRHPIDLKENWKHYFLPLAAFKGDVGLLDTTMIKSFFMTSLDDGAGSFTVDDITIAGLPYETPEPLTVSGRTRSEQITWKAWEDSESEKPDSMTVVSAKGKETNSAVKISYDRPEGSYGGQVRAAIPTEWAQDLKKTDYFTFWAKGDGSEQTFTLRFALEKGTNMNEQRSNFKKREFERFSVNVNVSGSDWKFCKIRFDDLGMSDVLHKDRIRYLDIFNREPNKKGSVIIDDFSFTNIGDPLKESYVSHDAPKQSLPVGTLQTKFPRNQILQFPKTFTITAGEEAAINIHLMNKTSENAAGELKIEGLPAEGVENAKYDTYAGYVSYPHYPWRSWSYSNFKVTIEEPGEYTFTVSDADPNGPVQPQKYKLIVK